MAPTLSLAAVAATLRRAGCVAADDEARELLALDLDDATLTGLLDRRAAGEPLAWLTGHACFCDLDLIVTPGVYVPRWQSENLARRAAALLPDRGNGVDLCTGSGALALVLMATNPSARVVATEIDEVAVRCAQLNGVDVLEGSLDEPLPFRLQGAVDVMTAVVPYVPTDRLNELPRDVLDFEPRRALDGGTEGMRVLEQVVRRSTRWLKPGGHLLVETGSDQLKTVASLMAVQGFVAPEILRDPDGDPRGVAGRWGG